MGPVNCSIIRIQGDSGVEGGEKLYEVQRGKNF